MDDPQILPAFWASGSSDFWLSTLIGLLTTISLSHIPFGVLAAVLVYSVLKYERHRHAQRAGEPLVRLPVQAL